MKKEKQISFAAGVALIVTGILFAALQSGFVSVLMTVVGALLIAYGIVAFVNKNTVTGAISAVAGILVIVCGWLIVEVALIVAGAALIVYGVYAIIKTAPSLKSASVSRKVMALIRPALLVVLGVLLIAGGATVLDALFIVIGVIAIIAGIALVVPGAKEAFSAIGKSVSEGADDGETREEKDASSVEAGNAGASSADEKGEAKKESHDDSAQQ